jgi:hypothetical protein
MGRWQSIQVGYGYSLFARIQRWVKRIVMNMMRLVERMRLMAAGKHCSLYPDHNAEIMKTNAPI